MGYRTDKDGDRVWDGKGSPESRADAIAYLRKAGLSQEEAEAALPKNSGKSVMGARARAAVTAAAKAEEQRLIEEGIDPKTLAPVDDADGYISDEDAMRAGRFIPGNKVEGQAQEGTSPAQEALNAAAAAEGMSLEDFIGQGPQETNPRGRALWPFEGGDELEELEVTDNMPRGPVSANQAERSPRQQQKSTGRTKARYYEADALSPLRWSEENRADLQRTMQSLGLYGDKKVRLGSWTAADQGVFAQVLAEANVAGVTWFNVIAGWKRTGLPADLQQALEDEKPKRPTIQLTNPVDIQMAARETSKDLIGRVDRSFAEGSVGGYQGVEAGAQNAYIDQSEAGGGQVVGAPSMGGYLDDKLRREQPLEVNGYSFLGAFEQFLSMMGAQ